MSKPRHWFHCTSDDHGPAFTPARLTPKTLGVKEPPVPRLCVCADIAGCFAAALFHRFGPVFVYRTEKPCRTVEPRDVWDSVITGERWLIHPARMILVQTIEPKTVRLAQGDVWEYHKLTRKNSNLFLKLAGLVRASEVLGTKIRRQKRVRDAMKIAGIENAEDFIIRKTLEALT